MHSTERAMTRIRSLWREALAAALMWVMTLVVTHASAEEASVKKLVAGTGFYLMLKTDGVVWGFGDCDQGKLWPLTSDRACKEIRRPRALYLPDKVIDIAAGQDAGFVLFANGTVMSWGSDLEGQLGTGPRYEYGRDRPRRREPSVIPGLTDVVQIAAAGRVTAALTADGSVFWWGERPIDTPNHSANSASPVRVEGIPAASAIALSPSHLLAIAREDSGLYAVGKNDHGQLGTGTTKSSNQALRVPKLPPVTSICASTEYSGAVLADATVREWGLKIGGNAPGTIAAAEDPDHGINPVPAPVPGVVGAACISCKGGVTGVVMKDHTLRLWGHDGWGQIGVGRAFSEYQPKPVKPALSSVANLFVIGARTFAVTTDGQLYFWGAGNTSYPEPMKTMKQRPTPFPLGEAK